MNIELERGDIVILASAHNPSMVTSRWLRDNNLILEEPKQSFYTTDFSLFESETFSLIVNPERLQITSKKGTKEALDSIVRIGEEYVKLSPSIAYKALGLNFTWVVKILDKEDLPKINIKIGSINDLSSIFTDPNLVCGGIIYSKSDQYLLRLVIEPRDKNALAFNFNHHYEIQALNIERIEEYLGSFMNLYENSRKVVEKLSKGENIA